MKLIRCFLAAFIVMALGISEFAFSKEVDFVTIEYCRSLIFGRLTENQAQEKANQKLREELNKRNPSRVISLQYGDDQSGLFRNKENSCIVITAWYEK